MAVFPFIPAIFAPLSFILLIPFWRKLRDTNTATERCARRKPP